MKTTIRSPLNRRTRVFLRIVLAVDAAVAGGLGARAAFDALVHHTVDAGSLVVRGAGTLCVLGTARSLDTLTDDDVLAWLRTAPLPCSADNMARHLRRAPGLVRLSLRRLENTGDVSAVDTVNGIARYAAR
ncbi:hypothetical protein [Kitasatospora sp. NPDC098663]|uniref:hypothetical protein n=1 Tax=Kitasatospora sp. NPDC098663 TaxID=3364096 RepID=UPI0037FF2035